jgi:dTDP-4-dehydrorhamnose reductase
MRILVTGVTGQVGAALLGPLETVGRVISADRSLVDLARPELIASTLDRISPDLIVNPAAYTAVDRAEDERELAFRVNAEAPGVIARWAVERGVPLVHFSTDYVFDGSGDRPWREDDMTGPLSVYGASKLAGEEAIRSAGGSHLIIRTSWVYAAVGSNFLRTIVRLARERQELRIIADQFGAPTPARLIANAVAAFLRRWSHRCRVFCRRGRSHQCVGGGRYHLARFRHSDR